MANLVAVDFEPEFDDEEPTGAGVEDTPENAGPRLTAVDFEPEFDEDPDEGGLALSRDRAPVDAKPAPGGGGLRPGQEGEPSESAMIRALKNAWEDLKGQFQQGVADSRLARSFEDAGENLVRGYKMGAASLYNTGANAVMLINRAADYLAEETGLGEQSRDTALGYLERWLRDAARTLAPEETADDLPGKVYEGLGAAPAAVAEYAAGIKALGPVLGFGAVDALAAADQGPEAAAEAAAKGMLVGKMFEGAEPLTRPAKAAALGTVGATQAAAEGGDAKDITASAVTMATLGATGKAGNLHPIDLLRKEPAVEDIRKTYQAGEPTREAPNPEAGRPEGVAPRPTAPIPEPGKATGTPSPIEPQSAAPAPSAAVEAPVKPKRASLKAEFEEMFPRLPDEAKLEWWSQNSRALKKRHPRAYRKGRKVIRALQAAQDAAPKMEPTPETSTPRAETPPAEAKPTQAPMTRTKLSQAVHEAATSPRNNLPEPTEAQKKAGNYKKAHVRLNGLDIAIENPEGSIRSGKDAGGKPWSVKLKHSYGYIKGTRGRDKDHLDVFLGPEAEKADRPVFVVDQVNPKTRKFDEHKIMLGFPHEKAARDGYLANYEKGWKGLGAIKEFTPDEFKAWLKTGDTTRPVALKPAKAKPVVPDVRIEPLAKGRILVTGDTRAIRSRLKEAGVKMGEVRKKGLVFPAGQEARIRKALGIEGETLPASGAESRASWSPGASYTGFIDDSKIARKEPRKKPIRREDVLAPLLKALNVPLYQGRVKGKGRMGFYLPKKEAVRIKRKADLETTAHEIAHLLDDRIPEIRKQWTPGKKATKAVRDELRAVSYDASKLYEGFAEFMRLYLTQNAKAKEAAPTFYRWFEGFIEKSEYGPAIKKARDDMHAWFEQDALSRAQSKIGPSRNLNEVLDGVFSKFRQSVADDFEGIYRMERELTGKISPVGPYEKARLTRGAYAMVEGALTIGRPVVKADGSFTFEGKGLQQILDPVSRDIDKWTLYAVGRSAKELMQQGREKLFTRAEINAMVDLETPAFRRAFDEYQEWNKAILDFAQRLGIINPESRKLWQRSQYLPFYRVGQEGTAGKKAGVEGNWDGIKALTGGTGNLNDVLGNMIQNAAMLMTAAVRNDARVQIADMADKVRGGGRFMVRIPKDQKAVTIDKDQVRDAVYRTLGLSPSAVRLGQVPEPMQRMVSMMEQAFAQQDGLMKFWLPGQAPKGDNVVAVLRDGKPEFYEVADPLLYRALSSFSRPGKHWLVRTLNGFRRVGQATVTLTVDFMAANMARDTIMGGVISRHGFKPFVDSVRGMKSRLLKDDTYREFIANGGGFSSYLVDETAFRKHLKKFYRKQGIDYQTVIDTPAKALYALETLADAFEMSTRLGEFRRARAAGEHPRHAAYSAREVSTDFAMRGDSQVLGFFYDSVMFLKAGINGLDRIYRGVAHDPNKQAIATKTALLALMSMGLYAINRDNELYDQLEDWDKDTHWHIFIPKPGADERTPLEERYYHFRYPKIWEVGAVASVAERTMEQIMNGEDASGKKLAQDMTRIIAQLFKLDVLPQAVKPIAEQAMNKNLFTKRPIETQAMQSLAPFARSGPYTSAALTELGLATRNLPRSLQISPSRAEALLRGYFNTWAMYGLMLADGAVDDDKPDLRVDQYPVLRRFYAKEPARHTKYETQFYDMLREATELRRTMRAMDRKYRPDIADELEKRPQIREYTQLTRANKQLQAINREIRQAYRAPLYEVQEQVEKRHKKDPDTLARLRREGIWSNAGALKRWLIDDLTRERNKLLKAVVTDIEKQRKGKSKSEHKSGGR